MIQWMAVFVILIVSVIVVVRFFLKGFRDGTSCDCASCSVKTWECNRAGGPGIEPDCVKPDSNK